MSAPSVDQSDHPALRLDGRDNALDFLKHCFESLRNKSPAEPINWRKHLKKGKIDIVSKFDAGSVTANTTSFFLGSRWGVG